MPPYRGDHDAAQPLLHDEDSVDHDDAMLTGAVEGGSTTIGSLAPAEEHQLLVPHEPTPAIADLCESGSTNTALQPTRISVALSDSVEGPMTSQSAGNSATSCSPFKPAPALTSVTSSDTTDCPTNSTNLHEPPAYSEKSSTHSHSIPAPPSHVAPLVDLRRTVQLAACRLVQERLAALAVRLITLRERARDVAEEQTIKEASLDHEMPPRSHSVVGTIVSAVTERVQRCAEQALNIVDEARMATADSIAGLTAP